VITDGRQAALCARRLLCRINHCCSCTPWCRAPSFSHVLLLQCPSLPPRHNHTYFSCGLCPVVPSSTSYISCACALLLPCRRPVSPAPAPYFLLADALPLLRRVLPLPRLRLVSPFPCSSVLISVSFRPRSKDPFVSTSRLFVSYPAFFSVSYPVSFRHVPRVLSSSPQGSFVPNLV